MTGFSLDQLTPSIASAALTTAKVLLHIGLIVLAGALLIRLIRVGLTRLTVLLTEAGKTEEPFPGAAEKRAQTLTGLLGTIGVTTVWALVLVLSLGEAGLDIRPILAGAGLVGLAVGFGAQNLVRDLISGFFIVLEDQVRIGDVAVINGTGGQVEAITFRTITLRDFSGVVHVFPNGAINTLSNMTKGWSAFVLDMGVAYKEDTDRVGEVMRGVGEELRADPVFGPKIIEPVEIVGVDNFADSAVVIRVRIKTRPVEQWNVGREYRRRLKKAFEAEGIEIPFPHRSLYMGEGSTPFRVQMVTGPAATAAQGGGA